MSVVQQAMFRDLNFGHPRPSSYSDMFAQFKSRIDPHKLQQVFPTRSPPGFERANYIKKRSYSDHAKEAAEPAYDLPNKRSKTAPPSPPSFAAPAADETKITLPSISSALAGMAPAVQRAIVPTVSLDYFDTYKPNDENWRYGLLDLIMNAKSALQRPTLPSISQLKADRPQFDSRVSLKVPACAERKINFPYESNYTYLNKTYMTDVERYPEYLELAQSLIQLLRPAHHTQPQPLTSQTSQPLTSQTSQPLHTSYYQQKQHEQSLHDHHLQREHLQRDMHEHKHDELPPLHLRNHNHNHDHNHDLHKHGLHGHHDLHERPHLHLQPLQQQPLLHHLRPVDHDRDYYNVSPSATRLPSLAQIYTTPDTSFEYKPSLPTLRKDKKPGHRTRFIPITPPSVKDKTRSELMKSPPRTAANAHRVCILCGSDQSPCWRPSWLIKEGQLCNSCGLRYKKTAARCLNNECKKIPAKGEWSLMQSKGKTAFDDSEEAYSCLDCGCKVEVKR